MLMSPYGGAQNAMGMGAPGQPQDFTKLFKAEKENLALADGLYKWTGEDVELRVLRKYGRIPLEAEAEARVTFSSSRGKLKAR